MFFLIIYSVTFCSQGKKKKENNGDEGLKSQMNVECHFTFLAVISSLQGISDMGSFIA